MTMYKLKITLRTKSPVLLSKLSIPSVMTSTKEYFSGTVIRGALASALIKKNKWGRDAHEHSLFRELLFEDIRFGALYPVCGEEPSFQYPCSLQINKEGTVIRDLSAELSEEKRNEPGFKSFSGIGTAFEKEKVLVRAAVKKQTEFHMSREAEEERIMGRSSEKQGKVFNYEFILPGQTFAGYVFGSKEKLDLFKKQFSKGIECFVGRSKFTQYGLCRITLSEPEIIELEIPQTQELCLRLDTPLIPRIIKPSADMSAAIVGSVFLSAYEVLEGVAERMNQMTGGREVFSVPEESIYARFEKIENFVGIWNMNRPTKEALAPGTVFKIVKEKEAGPWTQDDMAALREIMYDGVLSQRAAEGFGQMRIWPLCEVWKSEALNTSPIESVALDDEVKDLAKKIWLDWLKSRILLAAGKTAKEISKENVLKGKAHALSNIENALKTYSDKEFDMLRHAVLDDAHNREVMSDIYLSGAPLEAVFKGKEIPEEVLTEQGRALAAELGLNADEKLRSKESFTVYWSAVIRFMRKRSVILEKGGLEE